ncbi:MAG TPA: VWA domain-containing protein [Terriglobales bacterium]|nr:VWA domain-containing protein [Terriglobales bacterium]
MRAAAAILAAFALAANAQHAARPAQFSFKANTRLVTETVSVTDRNGRPIVGLTAKDFTITEDHAAQTVAFCEYQHLADTPAAAAPRPPATPPAAPATPFAIAPETPGNTRYANRRLLVLYFDMTAMSVSDQLRALAAAQQFIAGAMRPADRMAVMEYDGAGVKVKQDFTADRAALQQVVGAMILGQGFGLSEDAADAASEDTGSAFGQDDSEFNVFNTNRQLAALQTAVAMLAPLSEKKSLVYFASGVNRNGVDNQAQLAATTNAAIRANVALYPIDARGLVASAPLGDATQGSPGGLAMYNGAAAQAVNDRLIRSQDTLYALGADTGGKALFDSNDLAGGIATARNAIGDYYILGYYTSNGAQDGKFRRVQVRLPGHPGARLSFRRGYYADKVFAKFTAADKERQLEDALLLGNPITDLTLDLEVNHFQLNSAEYFVPIAAKIPGRELALAKKGGAQQSRIDFIGEVKDRYGTTITNLRDQVRLQLSGSTAAQLAQSPIEFTTGVTLLPGQYTLKLLARDAETGRIGTYIKSFTIPNLMKVADRLPLSTVVLGSQRVPLAAALFNAGKQTARDAAQAANPLVSHGVELLPSVTRVFSRRATMYVYLQAYEHGATALQPLVAYVTFFRGTAQAMQTPPSDIHTGLDGRAGAVPIRFRFPLAPLAPGVYTCQVTVLEPAGQKANFWRARVLIVP